MSHDQRDTLSNAIVHGKSRIAAEASQWQSRLERFLDAQPGSREAAKVEDLRLPPSTGGASSGTILFTAHYPGAGIREKMVLRYHPGTSSHLHEYDIAGQYQILRALERTDVPAPPVLGIDDSGEYFGVPGFLMGYLDGIPLPVPYPASGPLFDAAPEQRVVMVRDILGAMVKVHRVDWRELKLAEVTRSGKGKTALERNIDWYRTALRWGVPELEAKVDPALNWLLDNQFEPAVLALCHGDTSLPNYMFKDGRLVGVLDWEFAFIGAPELDLGFQIMADEILRLDHPPVAGFPNGAERRAIYEELSGRKLDNWHYYFTFACIKLFTHMALTFRGAPPALEAARDRYVGLALERMHEAWETARR